MEVSPHSALSALRHANYRYYWLSQLVSLVGTAMQSAALSWLVYTVTGSAALLGTLAIFQFGPMLLLSLPAGVFIDRWPKRRVLIATQTVFIIQAFLLSILAFTGKASYRLILPLASLYGVAQSFDYPCRRSYLIDLVGKDDLHNAISLNTTASGFTRIVGPSIAGIVLTRFGGGWAFLLNALSYMGVMIVLAMISVDGSPTNLNRTTDPDSTSGTGTTGNPRLTSEDVHGIGGRNNPQVTGGSMANAKSGPILELLDGLRYVWHEKTIRMTMTLGLAVMIFGLNENVLVPVFTDQILHAGAEGYGFLMSAVAVGALVAAASATLMSRGYGQNTTILLIGAGILIGVSQIAISGTRSFASSTVLLALLGFGGTMFSMTMYGAVQTYSAPRYRGRVSSVNALVESGTMPMGNAFAGYVTEALGSPFGFLVCGCATVVALMAAHLLHRRINQLSDPLD